jgi:hypothetical protein
MQSYIKDLLIASAILIEGGGDVYSLYTWCKELTAIINNESPETLKPYPKKTPNRSSLREAWKCVTEGKLNKSHWIKASSAAHLPDVWGPIIWQALHNLSAFFEFSDMTVKRLCAMFETLPYILPCSRCRLNLCSIIQDTIASLKQSSRRLEFINHVIYLHNAITIDLKPFKSRKIYRTISCKSGDISFARAIKLIQGHGRSTLPGMSVTKDCGCDK